MLPYQDTEFTITVEVITPAGPNPEPLLAVLQSLSGLPFFGFSVATNPVAKPRMSALAISALIQQRTGKPSILHCTTRDHNRLSLQGLLWGAMAMGIDTVMVATGDFVALGDKAKTTTVNDLDVFSLVQMASEAGLHTGVVLDPHPEVNGLKQSIRALKRKVDAGARFAVTQPVYDEKSADILADATRKIGIPIIMGILPLRTIRHAEFLHHRVSGIHIPERVLRGIGEAEDALAYGLTSARMMLELARQRFAGACIMPPFDHYEVLPEILRDD